jgi:type I restriction enzyme M protein
MMEETGLETQLPEGKRWSNLKTQDEQKQLDFYRQLLLDLGSDKSQSRVRAIFDHAQTGIKQTRTLKQLITKIDELDWYSAKKEDLGDIYEGLLEKNAGEKKSGAGQYFTPRPLIDCIVSVMKPQAGELIQDPAAGTGGFLVAANRYIEDYSKSLSNLSHKKTFYGMELVQDTHRLLLMNLMLHGIEGEAILGDTLSPQGQQLPKADLILTNPPFGSKKGGGKPTRNDFAYDTSNKQLAFLQHIYLGLKPEGRAAVIMPDNVLFGNHAGQQIRSDLMDKCNLHTILRLPTGIFYAQGVKTNILFFQRGKRGKNNTKQVWVYDLRADMQNFGSRNPLSRNIFKGFEDSYGEDPNGKSSRINQGEKGRFRCFSRDEIAQREENLDIYWLQNESSYNLDDLSEPDDVIAIILEQLRTATEEIETLQELLNSEEEIA